MCVCMSLSLTDDQNSRENNYNCTNVLMRYTQFLKTFHVQVGSSKVVYGFMSQSESNSCGFRSKVVCPIVCDCDYRPPLFVLFIRFIKINI